MTNDIYPVVQTQTQITRKIKLTLSRRDIRVMLRKLNINPPETFDLYFMVPGGGDWSGAKVDIDEDYPIYVEWIEITDGEEL